MNAIQKRLLEFANTHGGPRELSRKLKKSDNYLGGYIYGKFLPGNKLQDKLRSIGCDIEWLMTGNESESALWKGLPDLRVVGANDPPEGAQAKIMLSSANCGCPVGVEDGVAAYIDLAKYFNKNTFYVEARGDSMTGADIHEGDMLLVDTSKEPKNGNIVLVMIGDKVSVKRFKKNGDEAFFLPDNPYYEPLPADANTRILAVVLRAEKWFL